MRISMLFLAVQLLYSASVNSDEAVDSSLIDVTWDKEEWLTRHNMLTAAEPFDAPDSAKTCAHPEIALYVDMPVLYINLDSKPQRRAAMEKYFGCLNLLRVPAVLGSDPGLAAQYLSHPLDLVPGLVDEFEGDPAVKDDEKRPQSKRGRQMFLGALGCFISHVKAAYTMLSMGVPAVLVLEDDMTPELVPHWMEPGLSAMANADNLTAIQLSIQTSEVVWAHLREVAVSGAPTLLGAKNVSGQSTWFASNGAYVLTRTGASVIMKTLLNPQTLRLNLTGLTCINIDICLFPFLPYKAISLPPLFVHTEDGQQPTASSSIIAGDSVRDQKQQLLMRWRSRQHALDMALETYIRRPNQRLLYRFYNATPGSI